MAIYVVQNPSKSTELIRYMTIIREASQTHASNSWIVYDSQFRLRQAVHPGSWARMNQELWSRFMKQQEPEVVVQTVPNHPFPSATQSSAMGKCHDFNNGHCSWTFCHFLHNCEICGQKHPKISCPQNVVSMQLGHDQYRVARGGF